jgi:hypothetical protein
MEPIVISAKENLLEINGIPVNASIKVNSKHTTINPITQIKRNVEY